MRRFQEAEHHALETYRGHSYKAPVRFIRASASWTFPLNPRIVWSSLIPDLTVESTSGDHRGLVTTNCDDLATLVTRYIDETLQQLT